MTTIKELITRYETRLLKTYEHEKENSAVQDSRQALYSSFIKELKEVEETIPELNKGIVPMSVFLWICSCAEKKKTFLESILFNPDDKFKSWFKDNSDLYARAWTNGCIIEKLYYIHLFKGEYGYLCREEKGRLFSGRTDVSYPTVCQFTEAQIKEIDERYLAFKEEV